jgi:hypothetical protein
MAGIIAANGHLVPEVAPSTAPSPDRRVSESGPSEVVLSTLVSAEASAREWLDAPAPVSGPIRTPSDWTICVSNGLVSIAIS